MKVVVRLSMTFGTWGTCGGGAFENEGCRLDRFNSGAIRRSLIRVAWCPRNGGGLGD